MAASMRHVMRYKHIFINRQINYSNILKKSNITYSGITRSKGLPVTCCTVTNRLGRHFSTQVPLYSSEVETKNEVVSDEDPDLEHHPKRKNSERSKGTGTKLEFQAETKNLLDIVANSLYSEKEVFIRELISNASDALEKIRYIQAQGETFCEQELPLEIYITTDDDKKTLTIQDTGIGLTKDELIENLGTIARSGSKEFLNVLQQGETSGNMNQNIIGQFGVGFYSTFMVADKIDVYTKSYKPENQAYIWSSDGSTSYEISEAENVQRGMKIIVQLKANDYEYCKEEKVREIIQKYSNFVGVPIYLNGNIVNQVDALWMKEVRDVNAEDHEQFYRFIANAYDKPRYTLHYKTDAPLNLRCVFYVPEYKPTLFDMSRDTDVAVNLYSKKVMIMPKANHILPRWLRFMKGVVDSEDIPLNLSRELLQDSALIRKIRWVLTNRIIKFFAEQMKKDKTKYSEFYEAYGLFMREGIVTTPEQEQREEIFKLLRFESSALPPLEDTNVVDYVNRMKAGSRAIYYLSAPTRALAESSPYMEAMKKKDVEVLYCFENYDELVLMNLGQYDGKTLKSIENEMAEDVGTTDDAVTTEEDDGLKQQEIEDLLNWLQITLGNKIKKAKATKKLDTHPCMISVADMGSARHFLKTAMAEKTDDERYRVLEPTLEINASNPIIKKLHSLKSGNPDLAKLVAHQLFDNSLIAAGLVDDPRTMLARMNELLTKALEKH